MGRSSRGPPARAVRRHSSGVGHSPMGNNARSRQARPDIPHRGQGVGQLGARSEMEEGPGSCFRRLGGS